MNGSSAHLKAVYTGGYLVRNVDQIDDYTNYARGVYADYYQCYGPGTAAVRTIRTSPSTCYSPSHVWKETERNEHLSHEFRLSTPDDWRARGIVGVFYEDNKIFDQTTGSTRRYRRAPRTARRARRATRLPLGRRHGAGRDRS